MLEGWPWLVAHGVLAIVVADSLRRMVWPAAAGSPHPGLLLDVWGPLALTLPFCFLVGMTPDNASAGWLAFGAPLTLAMMAGGAAMLRSTWLDADEPFPLAALCAWFAIAGMMLTLGAAHDLSLWMGQCAFAAGALLLWVNTPEDAPQRTVGRASGNGRGAGRGLVQALLAAAAQAFTLRHMPEACLKAAAGLTLSSATVAIGALAVIAGPWAAVRVGAWAAAYGALFSLGIASLLQLMPRVVEVVAVGDTTPVRNVAHGFGRLAWEAVAMVLVGGMIVAARRIDPRAKHVMGASAVLVTAALVGWRLASL